LRSASLLPFFDFRFNTTDVEAGISLTGTNFGRLCFLSIALTKVPSASFDLTAAIILCSFLTEQLLGHCLSAMQDDDQGVQLCHCCRVLALLQTLPTGKLNKRV
jgi:hypothetical protein